MSLAKTRRHLRASIALACACACSGAGAAALSGTLTSVGSDTLGDITARWAETFRAEHAQVIVQVQTPGSAGAPQALLAGAASFGSMSRAMSSEEIARFSQRYGYAPTRLTVARDAIAIFVHPDNPLTSISVADVAAIFGAPGACARPAAANDWAAFAGAQAATLAQLPDRILRVGRNDASGTSSYLDQTVLCNAGYRRDTVQLPGAGAVVAAVAANRGAIGYAGVGYSNGLVKVLALRGGVAADTALAPDSADYPLARPLYVYFNQPPGQRATRLLDAWFRFVLSARGQLIATQEGFVALTPAERREELARLGEPTETLQDTE